MPEEHEFRLITRDGVSYRVEHPGESLAGSCDLDVALGVLDAELRTFVATAAPDHVFVHAGVVAFDEPGHRDAGTFLQRQDDARRRVRPRGRDLLLR